MRTFILLSALVACTGSTSDGPGRDTDPVGSDPDTDADTDTEPAAPVDGPGGFIGSACASDADCAYDGGRCLTEAEGYPRGMCSVACERTCPDAVGHPTTFCVDEAAPQLGSDGACHARCDFGLFPETGCRTDYGCVAEARPNSSTRTYACMPYEQTELTACTAELAARGVAFERDIVPNESPAGNANLTCSVQDPVRILGELHGVELRAGNGARTGRVLAACEMALALSDTIEDVVDDGVVAMIHYGTYNCRTISGTNTLSRHGYGDAIDIAGFVFDDGTTWTLYGDWEHTSSPRTEAGIWLYDSAYRWYDERYWNIILTPNYNAAHDDHFHVDLTPGGDFVGATDGRYIGPAPYDD